VHRRQAEIERHRRIHIPTRHDYFLRDPAFPPRVACSGDEPARRADSSAQPPATKKLQVRWFPVSTARSRPNVLVQLHSVSARAPDEAGPWRGAGALKRQFESFAVALRPQQFRTRKDDFVRTLFAGGTAEQSGAWTGSNSDSALRTVTSNEIFRRLRPERRPPRLGSIISNGFHSRPDRD